MKTVDLIVQCSWIWIPSNFLVKLDSTKALAKQVFFWVLELKRRGLFLRLAFMWLLLNHVKNLPAVICNSELNVLISTAQAYGVASSA